MNLFTIGYGGAPWSSLEESLVRAGVEVVFDVRLTPWSKSMPCYRKEELRTGLERIGITYVHDVALGNPVQDECRTTNSLDPYQRHIMEHLDALEGLVLAVQRSKAVAILCGCPRHYQCHRGIIAAEMSRQLPGLEVRHLFPHQGVGRGPAPRILGLTVWQPWAYAICYLGKRVENRTWKPWCPNGTFLAIHAGAKIDRDAVIVLRDEGLTIPDELPTKAIVAVARLEGVAPSNNAVDGDQIRWWSGPFGWCLTDVIPLLSPVPSKGAQGYGDCLTMYLPKCESDTRNQHESACEVCK